MKFRILALVAAFSGSAYAMPAIEGKYICDVEGEQKELTLSIQGEKLVVKGLSGDIAEDGLPCANEDDAQELEGGVQMGLTTVCNDKMIGMIISIIHASSQTRLSTDVKISKDSETAITLSVALKGVVEQSPFDESFNVTCNKR